ncbi:MAG: hypothetical protein ABIF92_02000 [archaeon]
MTKKRVTLLKKILGKKTRFKGKYKISSASKKSLAKKTLKKPAKKITLKKQGAKSSKTAKKVLKNRVGLKKSKTKTKKSKIVKKSFLEDQQLYGYLQGLVGEEGMSVVQQIAHKERSDVDLAEKMELKANIIRKHLYSMYEAGVVTYRRHRSKTGWYTYYWKLHPDRIVKAINQEKNNQLRELMEMLEYEKSNHFYQCKSKCTRVVFDEAADLGFRCMKCNKPLEHSNNEPFIKDLEKRITRLSTAQEQENPVEQMRKSE